MKKLLPVFILFFILSSCTVELYDPVPEPDTEKDLVTRVMELAGDGVRVVPARRLSNPYSVSNMQRAYEALTGQSAVTRSGSAIVADHYYVKFVPETEEQYFALMDDLVLENFYYPLDVEVPAGAIAYIDEDQAEGLPPVVYTWVPVGHIPPVPVPYTILDELRLNDFPDPLDPYDPFDPHNPYEPDPYDPYKPYDPYLVPSVHPAAVGSDGSETSFYEMLVAVSEALCEADDRRSSSGAMAMSSGDFPHFNVNVFLLDDVGEGGGGGGGGTNPGGGTPGGTTPADDPNRLCGPRSVSYNNKPRGRIRAWDDLLKAYLPVEGVKVRARRWFKVSTATTNHMGDFDCGLSFNNDYNYSIVWRRSKFNIKEVVPHSYNQVFYNGPKMQGVWNLAIGGKNDTSKSMRYAAIHRAAYRYYYGDTDGLPKPSIRPVTILYNNIKGGDTSFDLTSFSFPKLNIYKEESGAGRVRRTDEIYSVVSHELGHVAHGNMFFVPALGILEINKTILEGWGRFTEWVLTRKEYSHLLTKYNITDSALIDSVEIAMDRITKQTWPYGYYGSPHLKEDKGYSPLFIDLVDTLNQSLHDSRVPNDNVSGYTPAVISGFLKKCKDLPSLKAELKANKPSGVTDAMIDELLEVYEQYWCTWWTDK